MYCPKCGTLVEDGYVFCGKCGAKLPAPVEEVVETPVVEAMAQPVVEEVVETPVVEKTEELFPVATEMKEEVAETGASKPQKPKKKVLGGNGFSVAGLILAFFVPLLGFIFGNVGVKRSKKLAGKGKLLSFLAIILSLLVPIVQFIGGFIVFICITQTSCRAVVWEIFIIIYKICLWVWSLLGY